MSGDAARPRRAHSVLSLSKDAPQSPALPSFDKLTTGLELSLGAIRRDTTCRDNPTSPRAGKPGMTTSARWRDEHHEKAERGAEAPGTGRRGGSGQIDFDELPTYVGYQVRRTQAKIFADFEATLAKASTSRRAPSAC